MHKSVRPLSIILFLPLVALLTSCTPTIPSVIGQPLADAEEKLEQSGLRVSIKRKQGFDDPSGIVVEQDPQAGKKFEKDSVISLVVTPSARKVDASPSRPLFFTRGLDGAEQCVVTARPSRLM